MDPGAVGMPLQLLHSTYQQIVTRTAVMSCGASPSATRSRVVVLFNTASHRPFPICVAAGGGEGLYNHTTRIWQQKDDIILSNNCKNSPTTSDTSS